MKTTRRMLQLLLFGLILALLSASYHLFIKKKNGAKLSELGVQRASADVGGGCGVCGGCAEVEGSASDTTAESCGSASVGGCSSGVGGEGGGGEGGGGGGGEGSGSGGGSASG